MSDAGKEDMEVTPSKALKQAKASADENVKPGSADDDGKSPQKTDSSASRSSISLMNFSPDKDSDGGKRTSDGSKGSSDGSFEKIQTEEVTRTGGQDVNFHKVMQKMCTFQYDITRNQEQTILLKCQAIFNLDYECKMVVNNNFCSNYPVEIIVPVAMKDETKSTQKLSIDFDADLYTSYVKEGPEARLRSRFVAPVIAFDNKLICRSGTLTVPTTAIYERLIGKTPSFEETSVLKNVTNVVLNAGAAVLDNPGIAVLNAGAAVLNNPGAVVYNAGAAVLNDPGAAVLNAGAAVLNAGAAVVSVGAAVVSAGAAVCDSLSSMWDPETMIKLFKTDLKILKHCKVGQVFDLMVEYRKTYKEAVELSSTEKGHEDLYGELKLEEMPFPGCEFFYLYSVAGRKGENLIFDWEEAKTERILTLTEDPVACFPEIVTADFKKWDLIKLTQNYLKIMLSYLVQSTESVVVHCISGWDRTPLFISMLRLSLWADGVIHESLESTDIAYLTVAYDFFLFGHHLPDRLRKREEIVHFCFNFLEHIVSDEYSITRLFEELPAEKKANRSFPKFVPGRRVGALREVRQYVLEVYEEMNPLPVETKDADGNVTKMDETDEESSSVEKMDTTESGDEMQETKRSEDNVVDNKMENIGEYKRVIL